MATSNSTAQTVFVVLTIISSVLIRVAPFPDFYRVYKYKDTGEVAVLPVVLLGTNCCVLTIYGYLVDNIFPLFAVSVFGIFTSIAFIGVFYKWSQDRASVRRVCVVNLLVVVLVLIYTVIASTTTATHQSSHGINTTIGWISIVTSVGMFGSPLATIKKVVETKSAASLPFTLCLTTTINCLLWVVLCPIAPDMFVMIPNAAGAILSFMQVILWFIYRSKRSHTEEGDVNIRDLETRMCTSSCDGSQFLESPTASPLSSHVKLAIDFVGLHSPINQAKSVDTK